MMQASNELINPGVWLLSARIFAFLLKRPMMVQGRQRPTFVHVSDLSDHSNHNATMAYQAVYQVTVIQQY